MVTKQDDSSSTSLPASSSRRAKSPKNVRQLKTNVGCMSGIFRFVYGYSNRRGGKFITSGLFLLSFEKLHINIFYDNFEILFFFFKFS